MDGILCIDKPQEMTSFACCAAARRILGVKKVGHTGTLDPMATGVLPLLIGKATRALDFIPCHDKRYIAAMQFGSTSDTLDIWGTVTATGKAYPSPDAVESVISQFQGNIRQIPPMTSALKKDGKRLYEWARQGVVIERAARPITIYALHILSYQADTGILTIDCHCSKGTYIRSLCDDIGRSLGCGAVMTALRRTMASGFTLEDCLDLTTADTSAITAHILPIDSLFHTYPAVAVSEKQAVRFVNGGALALTRLREPIPAGLVRVVDPAGTFLGLAETEQEELQPKRLFK